MFDRGSYGKGTSKILLLITQGTEILEEDFTEHFCLRVVIHTLTLNELGNFHFLLAIESIGFKSAVLSWFTTDDVVVAEIVQNLFYFILDGKTRSTDVIYQQSGNIVNVCREEQLVCL